MAAPTLEEVRRWDAEDPLAAFRDRFDLPEGVIYLDGNSLGALPRATTARVQRVVGQEWGRGLIGSWNAAGWIDAPARVGAKIARLIGARPHEVVVADSTSVNLFKLLAAALADRPDRRVILTEVGNFPTDLYVAQGLAALVPGVKVRAVPRDALEGALAGDTAVLMLTEVHYASGARFDMAALTRAAHAAGALTLWDLSHSAGAFPVGLNAAGADLAVGCGYKYLNGGPGAPAFLYVAERHQSRLASPVTGWMGHAAPFEFRDDYAPAEGIARFLCGTPPILGLAALEAGIDLMLDAEMSAVAAKSARLCDLFIARVDACCIGFGLRLATPRDPAMRGSHVSFRHPEAYPIVQALIAQGVIGDFREPDILRFGFTPLYLRYQDAWTVADALADILASRSFDRESYRTRATVT